MAHIKDFLKRFLPPSSATVQAYTLDLEKRILDLQDSLDSNSERQEAVNFSINEKLTKLYDHTDAWTKQINEHFYKSFVLLNRLNDCQQQLTRIIEEIDKKDTDQLREAIDKISNIEQMISMQDDHIKSISEDLRHDILQQIEWWTWERFLRTDSALTAQTETLKENLQANFLDIAPDNRIYYWDNSYEKKAIQNNWGDLQSDPTLPDYYFKLIDGLDEKSIRTVNGIIFRQSRYMASDESALDLFTKEEQIELRKIEDIFSKEIVRLSDNIYAFRNYLLPINHFEPVIFYHKYCLSELDHIDYIKGKTVIDAGAYIGDTALLFKELDPEKIISFEPVPENMELLKKTIDLNGLDNVIPEQIALGAKAGEIDFYIAGEGSTSQPREEDKVFYEAQTLKVPVVSLDQYVQEHDLQVGLIKADLEGSEQAFLLGGRKTIEEQRPTLLICIYHNRHDFFEIKSMLEAWGLNYRFKIRKPVVPNATYETILIAERIE